ncbi:MAG: iron-containing alcohol dehydrogenase [Defluviitaleaceae bacterium]|nr:iron-containing alcohol dehydrogenase [Defluviitaleaceae bacterium]
MNNFRFHIPTELIFGKDAHQNVGKEVRKHTSKKILFVRLAKSSLERIGIYDDIVKSLNEHGVEYVELDGIVPNPRLSKVREGVEICRREGIEFILAVGGGSVVDTSKAIAVASCVDCDYWDIVENKELAIERALGLGTIITIPATGTEMNTSTVITRDEDNLKRGRPTIHPTFSILNPELAASLPKSRVAQSVVDMLAHVMERYFTNTPGVDLTDRMMEGVMKTIVRLGSKFYHEGYDYDTVSQLMYAATVAHNFSLCVGRQNDFATHNIGHELSGEYDLSHGESLSVIYPAWMRYTRDHNPARMAQFFVNVFGVENNFLDVHDTIDRGISALEQFYTSLNMPVRISQTNIVDCDIEKMAVKASEGGKRTLGFYVTLGHDDFVKIYKLAL